MPGENALREDRPTSLLRRFAPRDDGAIGDEPFAQLKQGCDKKCDDHLYGLLSNSRQCRVQRMARQAIKTAGAAAKRARIRIEGEKR